MSNKKVKKDKDASTTVTNIPMAIRFNPNEDKIEEIKYCRSLTESPQQIDENRWRKDFLQGNFFSQRRSGSAEEGVIANAITTENIGTWKLIKGKVTQAMEDIKSTKHDNKAGNTDADESDIESICINSSLSEDLSETVARDFIPEKQNNLLTESDSECDIDSDILITENYIKKKERKKVNNEEYLRKRINIKRDNNIDGIKKDINDIESGVEMLEDMLINIKSNKINKNIDNNDYIYINDNNNDNNNNNNNNNNNDKINGDNDDNNKKILNNNNLIKLPINNNKTREKKTINNNNYLLLLYIFILFIIIIILYIINISEFILGIITCLFIIIIINFLYDYILLIINDKLNIKIINNNNNNTNNNNINNNKYMENIYKINPVDEFKSLKMYSGWMCEITNYDPNNFHMSMTRTVYIKIDGSNLRISNTNARISKRALWCEQNIDKKKIQFTKHRFYNLENSRIIMFPKGLARKRYYSRKYPIQLIIKNNNNKITTCSNKLNNLNNNNNHNEMEMLINNDDEKLLLKRNIGGVGPVNAVGIQGNDIDFGIIMKTDINKLQQIYENNLNEKEILNEPSCGEETNLLLFARTDREKEDWYRRFYAASHGDIYDCDHITDLNILTNEETEELNKIRLLTNFNTNINTTEMINKNKNKKKMEKQFDDIETTEINLDKNDLYESFRGFFMQTDANRGPENFIKFLSQYQRKNFHKNPTDDFWKNINEKFFLDNNKINKRYFSWINIMIGRILFGCFNDKEIVSKIQEFLQKKLSAIKLPTFMEEVAIAQIFLGDCPPIIHRITEPLIDERGIWLEADITYEGLVHMTITTKLNLLRLKRQQDKGFVAAAAAAPASSSTSTPSTATTNTTNENNLLPDNSAAIYDSNAESSGASSTESDSPSHIQNYYTEQGIDLSVPQTGGTIVNPGITSSGVGLNTASGTTSSGNVGSSGGSGSGGGSSKRLLRIVNRITTSNLFQSATEISYIQRAMENMSTKIKLRVELRGLIGRLIINIPPPPSDRIWISFREPPRLWITAKPALGDHTVDWSIVTNTIENKLCEELNKYLVYPNMVDIILPILGESTYKE